MGRSATCVPLTPRRTAVCGVTHPSRPRTVVPVTLFRLAGLPPRVNSDSVSGLFLVDDTQITHSPTRAQLRGAIRPLTCGNTCPGSPWSLCGPPPRDPYSGPLDLLDVPRSPRYPPAPSTPSGALPSSSVPLGPDGCPPRAPVPSGARPRLPLLLGHPPPRVPAPSGGRPLGCPPSSGPPRGGRPPAPAPALGVPCPSGGRVSPSGPLPLPSG